ncbi:glycosyltransferase 87 family protein [Arthrobacter sp. ISL-30]|uniref:glycosyltransferase 87 family protein n=1 Tax=Arthrobacter sp. ISL-30 TaxID=2819109 RepID=UPI001BEB1066|nr:glycosyltransferase 87 family protein [Arthrobacter sp. ISL-30]MBT2515329.1 DUF2029 domain-containing protein [Arthrobacter sp. ISL-30]
MTAAWPEIVVLLRKRVSVLAVFAAVHVLFWALLLPRMLSGNPYGDVELYREWAFQGLSYGIWQGIDVAWVYPIGAMLPMVISAALGEKPYMLAWFLLCTLLNLGAVLTFLYSRQARYGWQAAYLWIGLTAILGPVAFSRVDGITGPLVVVGLLLAAAHPLLASALLSLATWIKVWPAAPVLALIIASKSRLKVILAGIAVSMMVAGVVVANGGASNLFGFIQAQEDRGMQLEAPMTTAGVWQAVVGGGTRVYVNSKILTVEVDGSLADFVGSLMNPLLVLSLLVIAAIMIVATRRGADRTDLLLAGSLALVAAMIVFNKVGSPQFMIWLVAVVAVGVAIRGTEWAVPAVVMVAVSILTTLIYPLLYDRLYVALNPGVALLLTARNVLVIAVLVWAIGKLVRLARTSAASDARTAALESAGR